MSEINWPTVLPSPRVELSYDIGSSTISNQMETGRLRQRQRFTSQQRAYSLKFVMSDNELGIFEAFMKHSLAGGANEFSIKLPRAGYGLVDTEGNILEGLYNVKASAGNLLWEITTEFIANDNVTHSEDTLNVLLLSSNAGQDFIDISNDLQEELLHFAITHPI